MFELKWQEHGVSDRVGVPLDRDEPFSKEPDFGQRKILRGVLTLGSPELKERMGFAWDKSEGKLYVDLNRDGDLTNDPNGVLETDDARGGDYQHQNFPAFPISFTNELGVFRYQLSANLFDYRWSRNAEFVIRSSYSGTVDLKGVWWSFDVNDKLAATIHQGNKMSVHIVEGDSTNFISSLAIPQSIFLGGQCYEMAFEFRKTGGENPALWCTLTEKEVPVGTLRIEGNSVNQLVFGDGDMLILPPLTDEPVLVPVGDYRLKACSLKYQQDRPGVSPQRLREIQVEVPREGEGVFKVGTPLQNAVRIERMGKILKFHYELKGIGGETYDARRITNYDNSKKPAVAIYKGDMQVGSGEFEYG